METKSWLRKIFSERLKPPKPLGAGSYAYHSPPDAPEPFRLHLRIHDDGSGLLILNAATILHLNQTAAECAYQYINGASPQEASGNIARRYKVSRADAERDYQHFIEQVRSLAQTPDLDPESVLALERQTPYGGSLAAPYRLDCALTYRLRDGGTAAGTSQATAEMEMTTEQWKFVIDTAWQAGIPHLVFTGGEPTLRKDLEDLLLHAEKNGQVTGLISDGRSLADQTRLDRIIACGLDHLMLILDADEEECWQALGVILPADLFTAVHLTITEQNRAQVPGILKRLADMGANGVSLSAGQPGLESELSAGRDIAADLDLNLVWDLPVPYSRTNPIALEIDGGDAVPGAGHAWLYVEPDGDVFPAQGETRVLGNILREPWEMIWQNAQT